MNYKESILLILTSILTINLDWILGHFSRWKWGVAIAQTLPISSPVAQIYSIEGNIIIRNLNNGSIKSGIRGFFLYSGDIIESDRARVIVICVSGQTVVSNITRGIAWRVEDSCLTPSQSQQFISIPQSQLNTLPFNYPRPFTPNYQDIENIIFHLRRRTDNRLIVQIQNDLWKYNYYQRDDVPGYFGFATEAAVRQFLQDGGIINYSWNPLHNQLLIPSMQQSNILPRNVFPERLVARSTFSDNRDSYLESSVSYRQLERELEERIKIALDRQDLTIEILSDDNSQYSIKVKNIDSCAQAERYQETLEDILGFLFDIRNCQPLL